LNATNDQALALQNDLKTSMVIFESLHQTPLSTVVAALTAAFQGYFVPLSSSVTYWEERYKAARVDWALSFGAWEDGALVAFIIHGVDDYQGHRTAFNTGTGVLASHRGLGLVDALYVYALPHLRAAGVTRCALEVIVQNERAMHVYQRIGFAVTRRVKCLRGTLAVGAGDLDVYRTGFGQVGEIDLASRARDSWDNTDQAIEAGAAGYHCYKVVEGDVHIGYFVHNPQSGYVPRLALSVTATAARWSRLLQGLAHVQPTMRINNIDERATDLISALLAAGLENHIDQYEMAMRIA
jgi:ribosomal protein S18 acetylase RimI-like enzyme